MKKKVTQKAPTKLVSLSKKLDQLRSEKKQMALDVKNNNAEINDHVKTMIEYMEDEGIQSVNVLGIGTVYMCVTARVSVTDEPKLFTWLKKNKYGAMIKAKVNTQSLGALVREMREKGEPEPDGSEVYDQMDVRIKK